jgi:putative transposase
MIMAPRKRHSLEQAVRKLTTADRLLDVMPITAGATSSAGSRPTTRNGSGPRAGDSALKRLLADAELEKAALKDIAPGKLGARSDAELPCTT